ncbi:MAG TPA: glycosyltransferase family 4 protein, partial [Phototrophicaceae bacterium]|nr:glycosyltransferase family 4 protein [Phototrophicaceae bacterium]
TIETLRQHLNLGGHKVILFAGRLTRDKGSKQLLAAFDELIKTVPNATLLTLTRATLEQQGLTTPQYRHLLGHVCVGGWMQGEELASAYQLANVVVVPSICLDVFPTINLEAMATAKPVIATCYGGSPEAIVDGKTGYIVNPFDTATFTNRLEQLLTDDNLAQQMGQAARERLETQFTLSYQVRLFEQSYQDAITIAGK